MSLIEVIIHSFVAFVFSALVCFTRLSVGASRDFWGTVLLSAQVVPELTSDRRRLCDEALVAFDEVLDWARV